MRDRRVHPSTDPVGSFPQTGQVFGWYSGVDVVPGDLAVLMRAARQLSKLCAEGESMIGEARGTTAAMEQAARKMHSDLLRTKHAIEDELVAWVLDCDRCGRRVHWVIGDGCQLGHWAHAEPAPVDHRPRLRPLP